MAKYTEKCALCGKEYKEYGCGIRMLHISDKKVLTGYGFYEPRLTIVEMYQLGRGEHTICTRRFDCYNRIRLSLSE